MRKASFHIVGITAVVLLGWTSTGVAYDTYSVARNSTNCRACHGDFRASSYTNPSGVNWGVNLHDLHRNTMLGGDCNTCHVSSGRFPVRLNLSAGGTGFPAIGCVGCHGRAGDQNPGAGLRRHHASNGVTVCATSGCHSDGAPGPENIKPQYYFTPDLAHPNKPSNPCNPGGVGENFGGPATGLDNDGDNLYDSADPDCQAAAPSSTPTATNTNAPVPTNTNASVPISTPTLTDTPVQTATATAAATSPPTDTPTQTATTTPIDASTPTLAASCPQVPHVGCRTAQKSLLLLKDDSDDNKDKLLWKWIKGQATTQAELSDPTKTAAYRLCVYNGSGFVLGVGIPANATKWSVLSDKGYKYNDTAGSGDGINKVLLKGNATADKAKALVKGKGANLPDPTLGSLSLPVRAQLRNEQTGVCLEGVYGSADVIKNDSAQFKAKAQ